MVEKPSDGFWYHAPTSSAAQCVRDAVIRTPAPLEIWNNEKLKDDVVTERVTSRLGDERIESINSIDSELDLLDKKKEELRRTKEKLLRENKEHLKLKKKRLTELTRSKEDATKDLANIKTLEGDTRIKLKRQVEELKLQEAAMKQLQTRVNDTNAELKTLKAQTSEKTQYLEQVQNDIVQIEKVINRCENLLVRESPGSDSKRLKEDHDFHQAKATSLEEVNEQRRN